MVWAIKVLPSFVSLAGLENNSRAKFWSGALLRVPAMAVPTRLLLSPPLKSVSAVGNDS